MQSYRTKLIIGAIGLLISIVISATSNAAEKRYLLKMPTANKTTANEVIKSKKSAFECIAVKNGLKGNANVAKGAKSVWFTDVPQSEDAADDKLAEGKRAVRCTMRIHDKTRHGMRNAEVDETEADDI